MEIEPGPLGYLADGRDRTLVAPSLILNWGLADRWEVVLEGGSSSSSGARSASPASRVEDTALSLKGVLREGSLQEKHGSSVATELARAASDHPRRARHRRGVAHSSSRSDGGTSPCT